MFQLIIIEDDSYEIDKIQQGETLEPILNALREWTWRACGGDEPESVPPYQRAQVEAIKQMSLEELFENHDNYHWGENNIKRVHVIEILEDGFKTIL